MKRHNITIEFSAVDTPQHNGIAERHGGLINEGGRTLLYHAGLSQNMWPEANLYDAQIKNRMGTKVNVDSKSPYELANNKLPDFSRFRIFGCDVYVLINHKTARPQGKSGPVSRKGTFLSLAVGDPGYKIFMWDTNKPEIHFNVIFDETSFSKGNHNIQNRPHNPLIQDKNAYDKVTSVSSLDYNEEESEESESDSDRESITNDNIDTIQLRRSPRLSTSVSTSNATSKVTSKSTSKTTSKTIVPLRRSPRLHPELLNLTEEIIYCDYTHLNESDGYIPMDYDDAISCPDKAKWKESIRKEIQTLTDMPAFELVDIKDWMNILELKYVFKIKSDAEAILLKYKTRLTPKGFKEKYGIDYFETYSPVVRNESIRILLSIASTIRNVIIHAMDIPTAFPQAELKEDVYMQIPKGFAQYPGKCFKLLRAIYGLKQSGREWNLMVHDIIISLGFIVTDSDVCIYYKEKVDIIYIGLYVDDMLIVSANQQMVNEFEEYFMSRFNCKPETTVNQFLGMKIEKNQNMIKLSNSKMVDKIVNKFSEFKLRSYQTPIEPNIEYLKPIDSSTILKDIPYREGVGSILYLSITCRNDIAFAVNVLSRFLDCPTKETWLLLLRCIGYLKYTRTNGITFGNLNKIHYNIPYVFCDSDWGGDANTGRSTTCYIIIFNGGPISWCSRLQQTVSISTTEAEYMTLVATL